MSWWRRDIETAPKDGTPVLFFGTWRPFDILKGGGEHISIWRWSTLMSDGTGMRWMGEGWCGLDNFNVDFTHWQPLPAPPPPDEPETK